MENINFILPGFISGIDELTKRFIDFSQEESNKLFFNKGFKISAVYGSFPGCIWNGGRIVKGEFFYTDSVKKISNEYKKRKIEERLVLTNSKIEECHLQDVYGNELLKIFNFSGNGIILSSEILENYIRSNYKNFNFIVSTTRCERNVDKINEILETDKYKLLVLDYRDVKNVELLKKIKNPEKIEILIDEMCFSNCQWRKEHYEEISKSNLALSGCDMNKCPYDEKWKNKLNFDNFYDVLANFENSTVSFDFLMNTLIPMGFKTFKLVGRMSSLQYYFESLIYYMIKPEFQNFVRQELLTNFIKIATKENLTNGNYF